MVEMANGENLFSSCVGFRFHPTDQEIISHFLKNKMLGRDHLVRAIPEVDICKYDPWELPESDDPGWFFFSSFDLKYKTGHRLNRQTRNGFWKPTGNARKIKDKKTKKDIGTKRTLVFHKKGRDAEATRTNWVINEYHSLENIPQKKTYVVCLLKKTDDDDEVHPQIVQRETPIPEELPLTLPFQEPSRHHLNEEKEMTMDQVDEFSNSMIVDPHENELQPPISYEFGECSYSPQFRMLRNVKGSTVLIREIEQDKTDQCIEFSGQANSGRAMSKIRLQGRIRNVAGHPFKVEKSSKYTWNSVNGIGRRSPSEYFVNVIVGIVLLIAFFREMVLYGEWGL